MSWHKITLPLITDAIDPQVVQIGDMAKEVYTRENQPEGFAMFHATRGSEGGHDDKFLVYLSPVASQLCTEIPEQFTVEPCDVPARDEPDVAFVFGDPRVMGQLKDKFEPEPGTVEWAWARERQRQADEAQAQFEAAQAEAAAQSEATQADSAQA